MNTETFNENYTIDRKAKGVKAVAKFAHTEPSVILTADGTAYDPNTTYFFFDEQTKEVRQSTGLRRDGEFLSTFGLRVIAISKLRMSQNDALADGQSFFKSQIETLQSRIQKFELEKATALTK